MNIPTITVSNAYVHHLSALEEQSIAAQQGSNQTRTFDQDEAGRPVPAATDGYGVWFAPMLNIPGVASGRLVFKRFENDGAVFVLNTFDNYIEAHFTGSSWEVHTSDGRLYEFGAQIKAVQMPQNKRWANYEELDALMRTALGAPTAAATKGKIANALKPRMHTLQWFCSSIHDPLHAPGQSIYFQYSSHGCFDMYKELQQSYYMNIVSLDLRPAGTEVISFENPLNGFPEVKTCQEMLLKKVTAVTMQGEHEVLELEHRTDGPGPAGQMVHPDGDTYPVDGDPMYLAKVVYRAGTFNQGSTQLGFNNWRRYPHYAHDDFAKLPGTPFSVNSTNPYIGQHSAGEGYYALDASTNAAVLPFNHAFLESDAIVPNSIWPGDLWEVRTTIDAGNTPINFDINVVTGSGTIGTGAVNKVHYDRSRGTTLFSTFDRTIKWNNCSNEAIEGAYSTSNVFMMPYVGNVIGDPENGNNGIRIQVGLSNSDTDFNMSNDLDRLLLPNSTTTPSAYNSYYHAKWAWNTNSYPNTGHTALGLRSHDPVPGNFGIGLPWSSVLYSYMRFLNNSYVAGIEDPWVAQDLQFWWSDGNQQSMPWGNMPTLAGPGTKLRNVELIRYGKQPYMLRDVKKYVRHGEQTTADPTGLTLVQHLALNYQRTARSVPLRHVRGTTTAQQYELFHRQIFELISVEQRPTLPATAGVDPGVPAASPAITRLDYTSAAAFTQPPLETECEGFTYYLPNPYHHLVAGARLLNRITDPLGQETTILYNDPLDFNLSDFHVLDNFHPGQFSVNSAPNAPISCTDNVTLSPVNGAITPSVKELRKSDENGEDARVWTYTFENKRARNRSTPLGYTTSASTFYENRCYRFNRFGGISYGYERVTVEGPDLGGDQRVRRIHHFHVAEAEATVPWQPQWPQSTGTTSFTVPAVPWPPADIATPDYHLWGRLRKVEVRDPLNRLLETTETEYAVAPAYLNGVLRPSGGKRLLSTHAYDYMDMHDDFVADEDFMDERAELNAQPGVYPGPKFLEYQTHTSSSKYRVDFPDEYLNSYFIKKVKETHTQYDPDGCGISTSAPTPPEVAVAQYNPNGVNPGNTCTTTDAATLISSLHSEGLTEALKQTLIALSPLQESVLHKAIDVADAHSAARLKEVLAAQDRLTDERLIQTIDKADILAEGRTESVIREQPWLTDDVIAEVMSTTKLASDEKTRILLEQPHIATALLAGLLGAEAPLAHAETERVLLAQPPLTTAFLLTMIADEHLPWEVKAAVLTAQPYLAPELFDAIEDQLNDWTPAALEHLLVHGNGYPAEAFLTALLQHATEWPSEVVRNILAANPEPYSIGLRNGIALAPELRHEDKEYLLSNAPSPLLQYCGNPCATMNLKVRNVTEYEYYDAAPDGKTESVAWRNLLGLEDVSAVDTIQLKYEPSWLLYRTHAYSPEYPGAYTDNEYFYLQDLRNRYDRHWTMLDAAIEPDFQLEYDESVATTEFGITIPVVYHQVEVEDSPFSYDTDHNCQDLEHYGVYDPPRIEILANMHEFGLLSNKFYEHRMATKNNRSTLPLVRSEYFEYSSRWNWEELPTYSITVVGESCPPQPTDGMIPQSERRFHDAYTAVPGLNGGNWQQFLNELPPGHSLVKAGNGSIGMIKSSALAASTGFTVLHANGAPSTEEIALKMPPFSTLMKRAILLRSVYTQADEAQATTYTQRRLFTEERPVMHFAQYDWTYSDPPLCIEWQPLLPFACLRNQRVLKRNWHTQPMRIENERGLITQLEYDHPNVEIVTEIDGEACNTYWLETLRAPGKPLSVTVGHGLPNAQTTTFAYAMDASLAGITDPNGTALAYEYDAFGRLWKAYRNGELLGVNTYHQWTNPSGASYDYFNRTAQNYTESFMRRERDGNAGMRARSFVDPNGRGYLTLTTPTADIEDPELVAPWLHVSGRQEFDPWDRVRKAFKPDIRANGTGSAAFALTPALADASPWLNDALFAETAYESDHRSRPLLAAAPGETLLGHTRKTRYRLINHIAFACDLNLSAIEAGLLMPGNSTDYVWARIETEDEDGNIARSYTNALGQQVATAALINGSTKAITLFLYDDQGALTRVINPEKQHTTYEQNILGLTYRKRTVDGGVTKYMYDQSGNVVLEQDANGAAGEADPAIAGPGNQPLVRSWYRRMHYDLFNRPVKQERVRLNHPSSTNFGPGSIFSYPVDPLAYTSSYMDIDDPAVYAACWPAALDHTVPCYQQEFSSAATLSFLARFNVLTRSLDGNSSQQVVEHTVGIDALPPDPILTPCLPPLNPPNVQPLLADAIREKTWAYDFADVAASATVDMSTLYDGGFELQFSRDKLLGRLSHAVTYPHRAWSDFETESNDITGALLWQGQQQPAVLYDFRSYNNEGQVSWQLQQFNANTISTEARGLIVRLDYPHYDLLGNLRTVNVDVNHDMQLDLQQHYTYDDWGRLEKVYLNVNDALAEGNKLAHFNYDMIRGTLGNAHYFAEHCTSPGTAQPVGGYSLDYDERDRLTAIKGPHYEEYLLYDADGTSHAVAGNLVGDAHYNGSINALEHHYLLDEFANYDNTRFEEPTHYAFQYDGLGRMTRADAVVGDLVLGLTNPFDPRFRVGDEYDSFDRIGNFRQVLRYSFPTAATAPAMQSWWYQYAAATSRLLQVEAGNGSQIPSRSYTYDAAGNLLTDPARNLQGSTMGRANLPFRLHLPVGTSNYEARYLYDAADMRVYKRRNKVNGAVETQAFHLRDAAGRELGVLDLAGGNDPENNDPLTGAWTWYAFGAQRFAKITPQQQPPLLTSDLGRWGQIDPDQAIYQALLTWLAQQNAQPGGISLPQTPYFVQHLPGGAYTHYTQADYVAAAQDPGFAALPFTAIRLTDMRTQVSLKRHGSEESILVSIEELLGMGQAKSGSNGVPFTYTNPYGSNSLDQVTYYLHDHLGNMRVTYTAGCKKDGPNTAPYRELALEHAADYHPYGSILREWRNGEAEKYLTTHHERDTETGLDYRGARYYDSDVARFLSLDPLAADYTSWSTYNYVMGNPVSLVDPDGRSCGCPPPCNLVVNNFLGAWNEASAKVDQTMQSVVSGAKAFGNWLSNLPGDGGFLMTSDYATGTNKSDRKGNPSESWDVTAIEARANATFGPEKLSPVKVGLAGKWMENMHDIAGPAAGATQEILNPTPAPLIWPSPLETLRQGPPLNRPERSASEKFFLTIESTTYTPNLSGGYYKFQGTSRIYVTTKDTLEKNYKVVGY